MGSTVMLSPKRSTTGVAKTPPRDVTCSTRPRRSPKLKTFRQSSKTINVPGSIRAACVFLIVSFLSYVSSSPSAAGTSRLVGQSATVQFVLITSCDSPPRWPWGCIILVGSGSGWGMGNPIGFSPSDPVTQGVCGLRFWGYAQPRYIIGNPHLLVPNGVRLDQAPME